jgi:DivIVA domain-containing protein
MDRESIERSDFPLVRRGYDPAAVDAHLRAVAAAAQGLAQHAASVGEPSLGSAAATRVQGILEAAQNTAGEIEREAQRDAQRTREEAAGELERARAHVETLARAAAALLAQVQSLDSEVSTLAQSLRAEGASQGDASREGTSRDDPPKLALPAEEERETPLPAAAHAAEERLEAVPSGSAPAAEEEPEAVPAKGEDLDGARLVALNMALGGEPREQTDRYLADSFQLSDRAKLLDEVYAAVEG